MFAGIAAIVSKEAAACDVVQLTIAIHINSFHSMRLGIRLIDFMQSPCTVAGILGPPHTERMCRRKEQIHVAIAVEIIRINIGTARQRLFAVVRFDSDWMKRPVLRAGQISWILPPAMSNQDVSMAV